MRPTRPSPPARQPFPEDRGESTSNIAFNKARWGDRDLWENRDQYGYRWAGGVQQGNSGAAAIAQKYLLPHLEGRLDLKVLEVAPGAGRFTTELIRVSDSMHLLDLNEVCIEICKERFKYYPAVKFYVGDGKSCSVVDETDFDLIVSFDSMVHMTPDVIESYVDDFSGLLKSGGLCWLDHSGKGYREIGHRTAMTDEMMRQFAAKRDFEVLNQYFRNDHDCISVLRKR